MAFARIRLRRATLTEWTTANPILLEGEWAVVVPDTGVGTGKVKIKIGDGVKTFNNLPYAFNEAEIDISELQTVFEDYEVNPSPTPEQALPNIITGKPVKTLFSNIKAFLKGTVTLGRLANNLITTGDGFALDAKQGPVIQGKFDEINSNLGNLSNNLSALVLVKYAAAAQAELDAIINDLTRYVNGTHYRFIVNINSSALSLGGGSWFIEGLKIDADYGWQKAIQYGSPTTIRYRSKLVSWAEWIAK